LDEEDAQKKIADAAKEMERAAQQIADGQNPDKAQDDAKKKLEEAQKQHQQAQKAVVEQLARERLAKIATQIEGLKKRQDAAVREAERITKDLMQKRQWTGTLLKNLESLADNAQKGLAKETASLKEKLKDAKAFSHILDRAAQAMDKAAEEMLKRQRAGVE